MPVASGAAGRVDVGVKAGTTWSPDGVKRKPVHRSCDSYLQRKWCKYRDGDATLKIVAVKEVNCIQCGYKDLKKSKRNKCGVLQVPQNHTPEPCDRENNGDKEEKLQENGGSDGQDSEEPAVTEKSKNSRVCVLL